MKSRLILPALCALILTGCPIKEPEIQDTDMGEYEPPAQTERGDTDRTRVGRTGDAGSMEGSPIGQASGPYAREAIYDPDSPLRQRIFYFDFDNSTVPTEYINVLAEHGVYLASNPDVRVRVEGHTDERGSREYNIALGERRAQAVQKALLYQGAAPNMIEVISYGEEKPAAYGQNEESWAKNRRVELIYEVQ